jgi:hypothetical protein
MRALSIILVAAAAAAVPAAAHAYPQYQLSTGAARCNQCHVAPAGGGLLTNYGRDESADTISRGGDGALLHGAWEPPSWLNLGGDFRFVSGLNYVGNDDGAEPIIFPMQTDLYQQVKVKDFSLVLIEGYIGAVRPEQGRFELSSFASREHYLMWRPNPQGLYARAGRFMPPFGLRLPEHPAFVRRHLGFHTLEETYGVSGGYVVNGWEVHGTLFVPDFWRPVEHPESGGAVLYERRLGRGAQVGGQVRYGTGDDFSRLTFGVIGKKYFEDWHLMLMGEADVVRKMLSISSGDDITQLAGYLSATYFIMRGLEARAAWEYWDHDMATRDVAQNGLSLQVQYFPFAHLEVMLYLRTVLQEGADTGLGMLQIHYYL